MRFAIFFFIVYVFVGSDVYISWFFSFYLL
jgi:hypothetical protein